MPNAPRSPSQDAGTVIEGVAAAHKPVLMRALPDALRISCTGDIVRIDLPDGDLRFRIHSTPEGTRVGLQVVYREDRPSGRTWWSSWERSVAAPPASPSVGAVIAAEVAASRREFARELYSIRICEAEEYRLQADEQALSTEAGIAYGTDRRTSHTA